MKENLHFKWLRVNYRNNQKNPTTKKKKIKLAIVSNGVDVVAKTDDEIYVWNIIKIYSYFSFVLSVVPKKIELLKISKVM